MFGSEEKTPTTDTVSDLPASPSQKEHSQSDDGTTNPPQGVRRKSDGDLTPGQEEQAQGAEVEQDKMQYLTGASLALVMAAIMATTFLVALVSSKSYNILRHDV